MLSGCVIQYTYSTRSGDDTIRCVGVGVVSFLCVDDGVIDVDVDVDTCCEQ